MRRLIYDMYYADEISVDIAIKLLDKLEQSQEKRRKNGKYQQRQTKCESQRA